MIVLSIWLQICKSNEFFFFAKRNVHARKIGRASEVLCARARLIGIGQQFFKACTKLFLSFIKMHNIIQIDRLRYAKIWGKRSLETKFHDTINNCSEKRENLKPQRSLWDLFLLCLHFRRSPEKIFSQVAVLKFCKMPWKTSVVDFCFSWRT